jgi:hypothetical protein
MNTPHRSCLASARSALECGGEAPGGNAHLKCLIRLPGLDTRAPRPAKAAASRPHSKAPHQLRNQLGPVILSKKPGGGEQGRRGVVTVAFDDPISG